MFQFYSSEKNAFKIVCCSQCVICEKSGFLQDYLPFKNTQFYKNRIAVSSGKVFGMVSNYEITYFVYVR